jgi:pyruvate-formate lyase
MDKYPLSTEKFRLITESFKQIYSEPSIVRKARALANVLDNITIFIVDGELANKYEVWPLCPNNGGLGKLSDLL